jgi:excisionase family DNA binding protein
MKTTYLSIKELAEQLRIKPGTLYAWAAHGKIPCRKIHGLVRFDQHDIDRWLTVEEEQRLLAAAAPWLRELVVFAIYTGMRMGEILALTWAGVDLFRRTVTVFRSKNGERRTIPVNTTVLDLLKGKYAARLRTIDIVFHSESHTPLWEQHPASAEPRARQCEDPRPPFPRSSPYIRDQDGSSRNRPV